MTAGKLARAEGVRIAGFSWRSARPVVRGLAAGRSVLAPLAIAAASFASGVACAQAIPDPDYDVSVAVPSYTQEHPRVVFDEAHHNFHTAGGRYRPLAELLRNDGYDIEHGTGRFESTALRGVRVLIVANARGGEDDRDSLRPAFTPQECDVVRDWVAAGGALLLIADHAPFGSAAADLSARFGVEMGKGFVFDPRNSEGDPTILVFTQVNGLLGDHPIIAGRNDAERVQRIVAFTGQSLSVPKGATALMRLAPSAFEVYFNQAPTVLRADPDAHATLNADARGRASVGRAQGVALEFREGRVLIMGEAAMFSAQLLRSDKPGTPNFRFGMNSPGNDDRQFALNALHWLSGALRGGPSRAGLATQVRTPIAALPVVKAHKMRGGGRTRP